MSAAVANGSSAAQIKFYTNHGCPWAQRAQITLKELGIPYEEVIIDLDTPRPDWYLKINPRGLVPSIEYSGGNVKDQIITESAVVAQFLADLHPSQFTPASNANAGDAALFRARVNFFVDTFFSKVNGQFYPLLKAEGAEQEKLSGEITAAIKKEIEPLLADASPYFHGSQKFTIAEALTAPFVLRYYALAEHGLLPKSLIEELDALPNFSKWAKKVLAQDSVQFAFDAPKIAERTKVRVEKMKAQAK